MHARLDGQLGTVGDGNLSVIHTAALHVHNRQVLRGKNSYEECGEEYLCLCTPVI